MMVVANATAAIPAIRLSLSGNHHTTPMPTMVRTRLVTTTTKAGISMRWAAWNEALAAAAAPAGHKWISKSTSASWVPQLSGGMMSRRSHNPRMVSGVTTAAISQRILTLTPKIVGACWGLMAASRTARSLSPQLTMVTRYMLVISATKLQAPLAVGPSARRVIAANPKSSTLPKRFAKIGRLLFLRKRCV